MNELREILGAGACEPITEAAHRVVQERNKAELRAQQSHEKAERVIKERNEARASLEAARAATKVALATAKDMARERDEAREVARQALAIAETNQEIAESLTRSLAYSDASLRIAEATREPPILRCDPPWSAADWYRRRVNRPVPSAGTIGKPRCSAEIVLNGVRLHDAVVEVTLNGHPWSHLDGLRKGRWTCESLRREYGPDARIMWDTVLGVGRWVVVYESAVRGAPMQVRPYHQTAVAVRTELWTEVQS